MTAASFVASQPRSDLVPARRGIRGKRFYLNGEPIDSVELRIGDSLQGPPDQPFVILRKGKKNYVRLVIEG